ncbi:UvrABC system protein A [Thermaurantimonas aggregans]|uniref:UvrABC system protein A n=1 Tax=Thermaurantimonas aggregans TaxID=2173829 RepID=A0A401XKU0_9FLAO|nr:excinuclease ABC subunit UvrA [Thermaurantimonas aggregans]MCX8147929.1 excinuclease ABC subunit UvrA [Thermaurantimonas aggregans]GCD77591.1 UvrABC system protein A [Thermaurantimonas aggregans]
MTDKYVREGKEFITIRGARMHNLKNVSVSIPRSRFVVITGVSGSGKSSLAFDTLYAEGHRRYVESLSSYARQFTGKLSKPDVDFISGLAPAIAIQQKVTSRNSRSTVGTSTEIYDYLKLLFARIGKTYSPISGKLVKRHTVSDVVDYVTSLEEGMRFLLAFTYQPGEGRSIADALKILKQQGYVRLFDEGNVIKIDDYEPKKENLIKIVVDRGTTGPADEEELSRLADSVQTAFFEGRGSCELIFPDHPEYNQVFSNQFSEDGIQFEEPTVHLFSFNTSYGACPTCEGWGSVIGIDESLVIPDQNLSIFDGCVAPWRTEGMRTWLAEVIKGAEKTGLPIHKPYRMLTPEQRDMLWKGSRYFSGINDFFKEIESNLHKIQYRVLLSRYRGRTTCPDCKGSRLRKEAHYVKVQGYSISQLAEMQADELLRLINSWTFEPHEAKIAERLLIEITSRLQYLCDVGLGYLTLNRRSDTLSGGETQRIQLTTSLGSSLVGSMYILDEPSIGLHSRDTERLIGILKRLKALGNTVIVVEHDEDVMLASDYLIDMGPGAGSFGGQVVFAGEPSELKNADSLTAQYLTGKLEIEIPKVRRKPLDFIVIEEAYQNNLKSVTARLAVGCLNAVTGVSGSGKSTLINEILYPAVLRALDLPGEKPGLHKAVHIPKKFIKKVEFVDQNPIGKSSRSNPVTYIKAFDGIRELFANQKLSMMRGYSARHFSFNVPGGRCEACEGEGIITVEMQFMADVHLVCEECNGQRYKKDVLEVKVQDKSIYDVLEMTIDDAFDFFRSIGADRIANQLKPLIDVGLGYVKLGQSGSTLSGGEAQRLKLATFLAHGGNSEPTLFIFDEPTTGLHFHDVKKLLDALNALIAKGHTIVVIEHHPDVIKCADWIVDLGPEGGTGGGELLFEGTPEELLQCERSYTAKYLAKKLIPAGV